MASTKDTVLDFIEKSFNVKKENIGDDTPLADLGNIYSVGIISMINFIEMTFNIIVEDSDISLENFGTVANIVKFIESKV